MNTMHDDSCHVCIVFEKKVKDDTLPYNKDDTLPNNKDDTLPNNKDDTLPNNIVSHRKHV